jgi:ElaB/YqjD/DUF883 family membrane-anchored ribosome-binding protein
MRIAHSLITVITLLCVNSLISGCQSTYYGALEKVGIHKRDVMISRVEKTRDSQQQAKQQFQSALAQFKSVMAFDGGDLNDYYQQLNDEYLASKAAAEEVSDRIEAVESVSEALFDEWQHELGQYTSQSLRQKSAAQLQQTRQQYRQLMRSMKRAEKSIYPVLNVFKDQTLFLKHNLNAQAIASLKGELSSIELSVDRLITQMNRSIDSANAFIAKMATP